MNDEKRKELCDLLADVVCKAADPKITPFGVLTGTLKAKSVVDFFDEMFLPKLETDTNLIDKESGLLRRIRNVINTNSGVMYDVYGKHYLEEDLRETYHIVIK